MFINLDIASLYDKMFAMGYNKNSTDLLIPFNVKLIVFYAYIQHRPLTSISVYYLVTSGDGETTSVAMEMIRGAVLGTKDGPFRQKCNTKCLFTPDKDLQL